MLQELSPPEVALLLRGHMGLICGPPASLDSSGMKAVVAALAARFRFSADLDWIDAFDAATRAGATKKDLGDAVREEFAKRGTPGRRNQRHAMERYSLDDARYTNRGGVAVRG